MEADDHRLPTGTTTAITTAFTRPGYTPLVIGFTYPRKALVSANDRLDYRPKARKVADMRAWARNAALRGRVPEWPMPGRVNVTFWYTFRNLAAIRDISNLQPSSKAFLDGLVDAEALAEDDDQHVEGPDNRLGRPQPALDKTLVAVRVFLTPIADRDW